MTEATACPDEPALRARMRRRAHHAVDAVIGAGIALYQRQSSLPRLLPRLTVELADESEAARRQILARLARALRAERMRGRAGHWTYDLNRHIALHQAYEGERRQLQP